MQSKEIEICVAPLVSDGAQAFARQVRATLPQDDIPGDRIAQSEAPLSFKGRKARFQKTIKICS
jgi:hypothetical protein